MLRTLAAGGSARKLEATRFGPASLVPRQCLQKEGGRWPRAGVRTWSSSSRSGGPQMGETECTARRRPGGGRASGRGQGVARGAPAPRPRCAARAAAVAHSSSSRSAGRGPRTRDEGPSCAIRHRRIRVMTHGMIHEVHPAPAPRQRRAHANARRFEAAPGTHAGTAARPWQRCHRRPPGGVHRHSENEVTALTWRTGSSTTTGSAGGCPTRDPPTCGGLATAR
mmetsp:Transcript_26432/g.74623  ORF Transcript_26432/g.74623 Transcript_26432/m.74623 type:complete len:224 (-) Transcript_26432:1249-1920(-)